MNKIMLESCSLFVTGLVSFTAINTVLGADTKQVLVSGKSTLSSGKNVIASAPSKSELSKDSAIASFKKKCKELFGIDLDKGNYSIEASKDKYPLTVSSIWNIYFNSQSQPGTDNINATIDAYSGDILSFNHYPAIFDRDEQKLNVPLITLQEARKTCSNLISKLSPDIAKNLKEYPQYINNQNNTNYSFNYRRMYNGVPVDNDCINIQVDSNTGKITSYSFNWHKNSSITTSKVIGSSASALEAYKKIVKLKLCYKYINGKFTLVYSPFYDAYKYVSSDGKTLINLSGVNITSQTKSLTTNEKNEIYKSSATKKTNIYSSETAKKYASALIKKLYKDSYSLSEAETSSYTSYAGESPIPCWYFVFTNTKTPSKFISFSIRQDNGQIFDLNTSYRGDITAENKKTSGKSAVKWTEAYDKAINIIKELYPQYINDIDTTQTKDLVNSERMNSSNYCFSFPRMHKGVSCSNDNIYIYIDKTSGEPESIYLSWMDNAVFTSSVPLVKAEDAKKIYISKWKPALEYVFLQNNPLNNINGSQNNSTISKAIEVYALNYTLSNKIYYSVPIGYVNATNGLLYDYSDSVFTEDAALSPEEIKNSPVKRQLQIFSDLGLIKGKDFSINKPITRKEALELIVKIRKFSNYYYNPNYNTKTSVKYTDVSKDDDFYKYLCTAIDNNTITNTQTKFLPDEPLTKLEMAKWLINSISADNLNKISDILNINFNINNEPSKNYKGYIAIFNALHFNLEANKFNPNDKVTWEDMVYGLYNSMKYLKSIYPNN